MKMDTYKLQVCAFSQRFGNIIQLPAIDAEFIFVKPVVIK